MDTLSKIYYSYFKDYYNKLMKLQVRKEWEKRERGEGKKYTCKCKNFPSCKTRERVHG